MPENLPDSAVVKAMPSVSSRDRILLAAKHLFARNGYENTSTVAIAREAGTSESQLMKHFGSKQGLLAAIFDRGWANIIARVQSSAPTASPAERLIGVLEAMILEVENDPDLKELIALEAYRVRKDSRDVLVSRGRRQFHEAVYNLLDEMRNQGHLRADANLDALRAATLGMAEGLLREQVVAGRSERRADYDLDDIRKILEIMVPALASEAAPPLRAVNR
ncbi:MAG TPA: TetR/AcrR family transcriptional regulator [Terriglobales bacterium]|nr:TetR/AcrR family transcriptional regulator [Terriglobales bacterium]